MCEHCNKTEVTVAKLDSDEESQCEWFSEEERPGSCHRPALYSISEWYVEDHLCEVHKEVTETELEQGLADFLDRAGFGSRYEMRPIAQEETCDYISPAAIENWQPCGGRANYAKYILETWVLCAEHVAEMGYDMQEN